MAILKCIECQGIVSDKARYCPHCGCPIEEIVKINPTKNNTICVINNIPVDVSTIYHLAMKPDKKIIAIKECRNLLGCRLQDATDFVNHLIDCGHIPNTYQMGNSKIKENLPNNIPKCPTCGSPRVTKITAGTRAIDGLFFGALSVEGRAQWRCESCKHMW